MRSSPRFAAVLITTFMALICAVSWAAEMPTDSQRLVIDTSAGPVSYSVELALTPDDRASGLMNRMSMAPDHGMLFRFDQTRPVLMWMKNTPLSLDMLFIDAKGIIVGIAQNTTPFSESIIPSPKPVQYVLELNAGTASKSGISVGDIAHHRAIVK